MTLSRLCGVVAAVVGPLLVLGLAWQSLTVLTMWRPEGVVLGMDGWIRRQQPEVVIIGPSFARTDIDQNLLGRSLGGRALRTTLLSQPGSSAPIWYAILKNRVVATGEPLRLAVIVATPDLMVVTRPPRANMKDLTQHFAVPDEALLQKTWGGRRPTSWERALEGRAMYRDAVVAVFRDRVVGRAFAGGEAGGAALLEDVGVAVFGRQHADTTRRALPVVEDGVATAASGDFLATDAQDTFLSDLAAVARTAGARLAVVIPPTLVRDNGRVPELERPLVILANQLGVAWVDMRDFPLDQADYLDGKHMSLAGRQRFTSALAERLVAVGALTNGPLVPAVVPIRPASVTRIGVPPEIAPRPWIPGPDPCKARLPLPQLAGIADRALVRVASQLRAPLVVYDGDALLARVRSRGAGKGCEDFHLFLINTMIASRADPSGPPLRVALDPAVPIRTPSWADAYWVYPGTQLDWSFPEAWGAGPVGVDVDVVAVAGGSDAPSVGVGSSRASFSSEGQYRSARVTTPELSGPWTVSVASPVDGPYLVVRGLRVRDTDGEVEVIKAPRRREIDLFGKADVTGLALPAPAPLVISGKGLQFSSPAPWSNRVGCSPFEVVEDETPLARPRFDKYLFRRPILAGAEHLGEELVFITPDGSDPRVNGRTYTSRFATDRRCWVKTCPRCNTRMWLYPGDSVVATADIAARARLGGSLAALQLRADWNVDPPTGASLPVEVRHAGKTMFNGEFSLVDLSRGARIAIDPPISPEDAEPLEVRITSSLDLPHLLLLATGVE